MLTPMTDATTRRALTVDTVAIGAVRPHPENPRRGDTARIGESLDVNGQYRAIVVSRTTGHILAGNHTWAAARDAGATTIQVTYLDDLTPTDERRIMAADNRTADLGTYDDAQLRAVLDALAEQDALAGSGWTELEVAALAPPDVPDQAIDADAVPDPPGTPVTAPGDVWLLGPHRLICGDSRDPDTIARLLGGASVNIAFTSPPYADKRTYDDASGFHPIAPEEYVAWFAPVAANVAAHLADDGSWFVNIKPGVSDPAWIDTELYVFDLVLAHVRQWGWHFATEYCWERVGVPKQVSRRFKNQFEPIYQFTRGDWKMRPDAVRHPSDDVPVPGGPGVGATTWSAAQGGNGRMFGGVKPRRKGTTRRDVMASAQGTNWAPRAGIGPGLAYPGNRLPPFSSSHEATGHTAAFPVDLPAWFIRAYTDPGDAVLDPFTGSGSTLIAAHHHDRVGYGADISPRYVDTTCRRWQRFTGQLPVLEATGEPVSFDPAGSV